MANLFTVLLAVSATGFAVFAVGLVLLAVVVVRREPGDDDDSAATPMWLVIIGAAGWLAAGLPVLLALDSIGS